VQRGPRDPGGRGWRIAVGGSRSHLENERKQKGLGCGSGGRALPGKRGVLGSNPPRKEVVWFLARPLPWACGRHPLPVSSCPVSVCPSLLRTPVRLGDGHPTTSFDCNHLLRDPISNPATPWGCLSRKVTVVPRGTVGRGVDPWDVAALFVFPK
jgi:hypothetical protein